MVNTISAPAPNPTDAAIAHIVTLIERIPTIETESNTKKTKQLAKLITAIEEEILKLKDLDDGKKEKLNEALERAEEALQQQQVECKRQYARNNIGLQISTIRKMHLRDLRVISKTIEDIGLLKVKLGKLYELLDEESKVQEAIDAVYAKSAKIVELGKELDSMREIFDKRKSGELATEEFGNLEEFIQAVKSLLLKQKNEITSFQHSFETLNAALQNPHNTEIFFADRERLTIALEQSFSAMGSIVKASDDPRITESIRHDIRYHPGEERYQSDLKQTEDSKKTNSNLLTNLGTAIQTLKKVGPEQGNAVDFVNRLQDIVKLFLSLLSNLSPRPVGQQKEAQRAVRRPSVTSKEKKRALVRQRSESNLTKQKLDAPNDAQSSPRASVH